MPVPVEDYAYDGEGNRTSRTSKTTGAVETYSYDSQNRLIGYISPATTATYAYDALDRRIAKTVDGVTEAWVYDTADLGDSTASNTALTFRAGALVKRWLFGPQTDEPLAYEAYTSTTAPGSGSVIELLANRLSSIITAISVSTGAVAADYDYQAYGARTETAVLDQPYGFTGREHDSESGLMHFRARAYDPEAGLFLQVDPAEFATGTHNVFAYVSGNPSNSTDPDGLASRQKRSSARTMLQIEKDLLEEAEAQMREAAITAVAEGVFGLVGYIVGAIAFVQADIDAMLEANKGGPNNKHHCYPKYMSSDAKIGLLKDLDKKTHDLVHKAMQEYMSVFNLKWTSRRGGKVIRRDFSQAYMQRVSRNFYDDMYLHFKWAIGC